MSAPANGPTSPSTSAAAQPLHPATVPGRKSGDGRCLLSARLSCQFGCQVPKWFRGDARGGTRPEGTARRDQREPRTPKRSPTRHESGIAGFGGGCRYRCSDVERLREPGAKRRYRCGARTEVIVIVQPTNVRLTAVGPTVVQPTSVQPTVVPRPRGTTFQAGQRSRVAPSQGPALRAG